MKTKVQEVNDLYYRYFKGELKDEEYKQLSNLLQGKENKELFQKAKEKWEKNPDQNEPAIRNWKLISYRIFQESNYVSGYFARKTIIYRALPYAAIFAIGLFLGILAKYFINASDSIVSQEIAYSAPYGAKSKILLPDSSIVWLNSGSVVTYASDFSNDRSISLEGEGYFEVRKGEKPFVVSTTYGEIEVKGTTFNVLAYPDDNLFQTTLVEGIVSLSDKSKKNTITLHPGQQAVFNKRFNVSKVETELFTSWKEGKLIFKNDALPVVVKKLERWYNVKIELVDYKELSKISYSGTIELESFSEVLQLLKVTTPGISYTYDNNTRIIKINYKK